MTNAIHSRIARSPYQRLATSLMVGGVLAFSGALASAAPGPHTPANARDREAPVLMKAPTQGACSLKSSAVYVHRTTSLQAADQTPRTLRVLRSGAWILVEGGSKTSGCLTGGALSTFARALQRADFSPPPKPAFQCRAMPTTSVTVSDRLNRRSYTYSAPCGDPVSASLQNLITDTQAAVAMTRTRPSPPTTLPMPTPPSAQCALQGAPIYTESRKWVNIGASDAPMQSLTVYSSGAWSRNIGHSVESGCLTKKQRAALTRFISRARFTLNTVKGPRCSALVAERHSVTTTRGRLTWEGPCGAQTPHRSVSRLQQKVHTLLDVDSTRLVDQES